MMIITQPITSCHWASKLCGLFVLLECNLDGKSKVYKDVAQSYFLMNNAHYIVGKVKQSEVSLFVGEVWQPQRRRGSIDYLFKPQIYIEGEV